VVLAALAEFGIPESRYPYLCSPPVLTPNPCRLSPRFASVMTMSAICPVDWRRHTEPNPTRGNSAGSTPAERYRSTHRM
jgi:hypothetical protein